MNFRTIKNSLAGGQISPTALSRTDLPTYSHSCVKLKNMIPMLSGGAYRRPGTVHVDSLPITTDWAPRIFDFIDSAKNAYAVLFGKTVGSTNYAKSYRGTSNYGTQAGTVTGAHDEFTGNPSVIPWSFSTVADAATIVEDEIRQVQTTQSADVMFMVHPNHKPQLLERTAIDTFTIQGHDNYNALFGPARAAARPYLPINLDQLIQMKVVVTAGGGITHSIADPVTMTLSVTSPSVKTFTSADIDNIFRINDGSGNVASILITAITSATVATGFTLIPFGGGVGTNGFTYNWWEAAWNRKFGYPSSVCLFQSRICYAGTPHQPDTIWFSLVGNYAVLSTPSAPFGDEVSPGDGVTTGPNDSQPFNRTLSQKTVDAIQWLSPDKELLVGTLSQEWLITASGSDASGNTAFGSYTASAQIQSHYGSTNGPAQRIGYELIFPMQAQDELRAYQYNYFDQSFFAEPIQLLFDEYPQPDQGLITLGRRAYRTISWDVTRSTLWCLDTAGNFYGMTRDRKLSYTAWHTHEFGGYDTSKGTAYIGTGSTKSTDPAYSMCDGSVVSFAVVPNKFSGTHDVWFVVKRTINSIVNWQVERFFGKNIVQDINFDQFTAGNNQIFSVSPNLVDAAHYNLDNNDGSVDYTGFGDLEGRSLVGIYYDPTYGPVYVTTDTVTSGGLNLVDPLPPSYGTNPNLFYVGLPYSPIVQPVRPEAGSQVGTAQAAIVRIHKVFVNFYRSAYCLIGAAPDADNLLPPQPVDFSIPDQPMGQGTKLFSGYKEFYPDTTYDRTGYLYLTQDMPYPMTIIGLVQNGREFDES